MSEMAKSENDNEISGNEAVDHAGSDEFSVNTSGTVGEIGTVLTQPCSADVRSTRSMLKRLAIRYGATSAIGHAAHNMLEMTEWISKGAKGDQLHNILAKIGLEQARLSRLLARAGHA